MWFEFKVLAAWSVFMVVLLVVGDAIEESARPTPKTPDPKRPTNFQTETEEPRDPVVPRPPIDGRKVAEPPPERKSVAKTSPEPKPVVEPLPERHPVVVDPPSRPGPPVQSEPNTPRCHLLVLVFLNEDLRDFADDLHAEIEAFRRRQGRSSMTSDRIFIIDTSGNSEPWPDSAELLKTFAKDQTRRFKPRPGFDLGQQMNLAIRVASKVADARDVGTVALIWPYRANSLNLAGTFKAEREVGAQGPDWSRYYFYWVGGDQLTSPNSWQRWIDSNREGLAKWITLRDIGGGKLTEQLGELAKSR